MSKINLVPYAGPIRTAEDRQRDMDADGLTFEERALVNKAQIILERARARKAGIAPSLTYSLPISDASTILILNQAN